MKRRDLFTIYLILVSALLQACAPSPQSLAKNERNSPNLNPIQKPSPIDPACNFKISNSICGKLIWLSGPRLKEVSTAEITFYGDQQLLIELLNYLKIDLWMPSMGHGSAPVKISKISENQILVDRIYFIMEGHWQFRIKQNLTILSVMEINL